MEKKAVSSVQVQDKKGSAASFAVSGITLLIGSTGIAFSYLKWNGSLFSSIIFLVSCAFFILGMMTGYITIMVFSPPKNNPAHYLAQKKRRDTQKGTATATAAHIPILVCLGDSITHGTCSGNYVDRISALLNTPTADGIIRKEADMEIVNAGHNGLLSYTLSQQHVNYAIACNPDYICLLIGTNDVRGIYDEVSGQMSMKLWSLPEPPTLEGYNRNVSGAVKELLTNTRANIGILTLPPLGEDLSYKANDVVRKANDILKHIASKHKDRVVVLDVHSDFCSVIKETSSGRKEYFSVDNFLDAFIWMTRDYFVFGKSWNWCSRQVGNKVLTDGIHLNEDGAEIIAQKIQNWLGSAKKTM